MTLKKYLWEKAKKGSFTIEAACVMSLILVAVMGILYLCFFVHNRAWLTAAACESALTGSMEGNREGGNTGAAAGKRSQELGDIGFFGAENLKTQIKDGKEVTVSYTADTISGFGGFSWKLRAEGKSRVIDPVGWIRKIKAAEDIFFRCRRKVMRAEYKRDVSHNYLILQEEKAVDTSSYQVRMLTGNVIPSILKCHLQNLDGEVLFYYDITSKQSIATLFEDKKFRSQDIQSILEGFVKVMEELAEFLMNTDQLVLQPEYIYMDAERKKVYFCCLPGYQKEIQGQLRGLTEYILPKLDHEDNQAVMLGYGIYRKALEPGFQLEVIKEAIYQKEDEADKNAAAQKEDKYQEMLSEKQENEIIDSVIPDEQKKEEIKNRKKEKRIPWNWILCCGAGGAAALAVLAAGFWGVIPKLPIEIVLGIGIMALGAGAFTAWITEKKKRKQEQTAQWHNKIKQETDSSPVSGQVRKEENIKKDPETIREERKAETSITGELFGTKKKEEDSQEEICGETVVLSAGQKKGPAALISREPGELATIYLEQELTVVGKLANASDAVIPMPTVSRMHARIRKREDEYYLADLNSRNGTAVNGRMLKGDEEYQLQDEDQVDFAQARYIFIK